MLIIAFKLAKCQLLVPVPSVTSILGFIHLEMTASLMKCVVRLSAEYNRHVWISTNKVDCYRMNPLDDLLLCVQSLIYSPMQIT